MPLDFNFKLQAQPQELKAYEAADEAAALNAPSGFWAGQRAPATGSAIGWAA